MTHESLEGKWLLYKATRDGHITETLRDAYFEFVNDTMMINNLLREEREYQYEIKGGMLEQKGNLEIMYNIDNLTADSLNLSAVIQEYEFEFYLIRDSLVLEQ